MDLLTTSILPFLGILLGLVILHEAAHYITAKMLGVKVLEAGIGIPPRIWGFTWRDTEYSINALPMGAFVRMLGEEDPSDPESLAAQPKWKRTVIIASGAVTNLAAAVVLFAVALMLPHPVALGGAQIAEVAPGSPAQRAGLQAGDQILAVNGRKVESTADASYFLRLNQGSAVDLTLKRKDPAGGRGVSSQIVDQSVYSRWNPASYTDECGVERSQGPIGITIGSLQDFPISRTAAERADLEKQSRQEFADYKKQVKPGSPASCLNGSQFGFRALSAAACSALDPGQQAAAETLRNELFSQSSDPCYEFAPPPATEAPAETRWEYPWDALPHALRQSFESLILTRNQLWSLARQFNGAAPVTGPVGIAQATGEVVREAGWQPLILLAASISMSLGMLNLLPIPMLDGGRLFFIFIEFVRGGKRIAPEKEALVHLVGLVGILTLFFVITFFDIQRIVEGGSLLR